jgi:hypothetical protein
MVLGEQEIDPQEEGKRNFELKFMAMEIFLSDMPIQKKLGLEPGQEFRIDVRKESGAISLLPLKK